MLRELISRINRSFSGQMVPPRRRFCAPLKIWFDPDVNSERAREAARSSCILGETVDLSRTGIGIIVSSIRLKEKYLVGSERPLNIEIDLPSGKVLLRGIGRRYKHVGDDIANRRFLVGVSIKELSDSDRDVYEHFLRHGARAAKMKTAVGIGLSEPPA